MHPRPKDVFATALGESSLRTGAFIGTTAAAYHFLLGTLRRMHGGRAPWWAVPLAAALASLGVLLEDGSRRYYMSLYLMPRAMGLLLEHLTAKGVLPKIPNASAIVFILCQIPIMYGYVLESDLVDRGYLRLIHMWSGDQSEEGFDRIFRNPPGTTFQRCNHAEVGFHKEASCVEYNVRDFANGWWRSFKLYMTIYGTARTLLQFPKLRTDPVKFLTATTKDALRSGLFLSSYVALIKGPYCLTRNMRQRHGRLLPQDACLFGLCTGFSILFEKADRHNELCMYVVPQAAEIVANKAKKDDVATPVKYSEVAMFCVSMAIVLHFHQNGASRQLGSLMGGAVDAFFGAGQHQLTTRGGIPAKVATAGGVA